jgi:hypothetical protein
LLHNVAAIPVAAGVLYPWLGVLLADAGRRRDGVQLGDA